MSTAEAVSVYFQTAIDSYYYSDGKITADKLVQNIKGAVIKENRDDLSKLKNYFGTVVKKRSRKRGVIMDRLLRGEKQPEIKEEIKKID